MPIFKQSGFREIVRRGSELDAQVAIRTAELSKQNEDLTKQVAHWQALERASREEELLIRYLFDESPVPLVLVRFSDSRILYANHRAYAFLKLDREPSTLPDFWFSAEQREQFFERLQLEASIESVLLQLKLPHTDGPETLWVELAAQRLSYQGSDAYLLSFCDVTGQKLAEQSIRQGTLEVRALFAAAPVPLVLMGLENERVLVANRRGHDLFEVPDEGLLERKLSDYFLPPESLHNLLLEARELGYFEGYEAELATESGRRFWAAISGRILEFEAQPALLLGILDISSHKILEDQLRELATRDALTLAYNRRHFLELCMTEIERARRHAQPLAICMLDADHFKHVNDDYGHSVGDQVLQELCRACREDLRSSDVLSRVGGEEFVILFPNTTRTGAGKVAERIRSHIAARRLFTHDGRTVRFTVSIGVCELAPSDDLESLLRRADDAMYAAKRAGRNRTFAI